MHKIRMQKGIEVRYKKIEGADHFFDSTLPQLTQVLYDYILEQSQKQERATIGEKK